MTISHLRRIRSLSDCGKEKFIKLWKNMMQVETETNFKMLPDFAKNADNVKVFTEEE